MPSKKGKAKLSLFSRFRKHKKNKKDLMNKMGQTDKACVELNWTKRSDPGMRCNPTCFDSFLEGPGSVGVNVKKPLRICLAESVVDEKIDNKRPIAIVSPTRRQTNTVVEMNSLEVDESTVAFFVGHIGVLDESLVDDVDESTVHNIDDNTVVKTAEDDHLCVADGLSDMQPNLESLFNPEFEDTSVKSMDLADIVSSRSLENNVPDTPSLQERDNVDLKESDLSCYSCINASREETLQETDNVRIVSRNDNYFENQKSRNENEEEAVTGIQMFGQTNAQHNDVQDGHLAHEDNIRFPQESGLSPHSVQVATHEGRNASHQDQMFAQLHHDVNCSNMHDMPEFFITNTTVAKLVEKVDHLESMIDRLSRLVLLTLRSNSRIPDSMKKQDLIISEFQENCKAYFDDDDDIISPIEENLIQETFLPADSFIHSECEQHNQHSSSACVCLASRTFDLGSLQDNRRQVSPPAHFFVIAEAMNSTSLGSMGQEDAEKTEKIQKKSKDLKICEPANQLMTMSMLNRPLWDTGPESDYIGHTLSLQMNLSEENLEHNLDLQQNLEGQAEISQLQSVLKMINPFKVGRNCSIPEEMIILEKDGAENHGLDSLKGSETEDMNLIEDKSRRLSDAILTQSVNMGHTNMASLENSENDEQLDMAIKSTTVCVRAVDGLTCSRKDYTDTGITPVVDDKPTFINSDADVPCGRDSVKDQVWNNLNLETDEMLVSASKFIVEAAYHCSSTDTVGEGCLNQMEDVMGLSSSVLKVKETDCCQNVDARTLSCVGQMDSNINVCTVKTVPSEFFPELDPVISDPEHIPGHDIPAQHEESQQRQVSVGYSDNQVLDSAKEEFTGKSQTIQDCDPKKQSENKFISGGKVQERKLKGTRYVLNKKKSTQRSKSGIRCRHCSLHKRRGKKGNVKLKKNMESDSRVSHVEKFPRILSDLKLLHYLSISFPQGTDPGATLMNQTTIIRTKKSDLAAELGILVPEKNNSSQESLINDFLRSLVSTWFIFPTINRNGLQTVTLLPTGLQLYYERLLRGPPPEETERMSYEWLRLQTFINYPSSAPGSGIRLARAGFYYSGNGTVTVCYACGGQHSGWNIHDDPFEIHRRISPDCPYLRGNPTYPNVPIMQDGAQIGIQMGNNASNMSVSPSSSNRTSGTPHSAASQTQISAVTQVGVEPYAASMPSIHSLENRGSNQQVSEQNMLKVENSLGIVPHSINSTVLDQPVLPTAAVVPRTIGECQERQSSTTVATTLHQQPTDHAENTQTELTRQVEVPGVGITSQMRSEQPRHPEYAPLSSRVNSYTGWPAYLDQTPQQMAEAGFFYAGTMDHTRCFQCGGGLRNWESGDNPWIEHARWYPHCAYVLGRRGQRFVDAVLKKQAELLAAQCAQRNNSNTTPTSVTNLSSGAVSMTCIQSVLEPSTQLGEPGHIRYPNEDEITNRLITEMGYQRETVREAILEVKRRKGRQEIALEHVTELLIADEERRVRASRQSEASALQELMQESTQLTLRDDSQPFSAIPPAIARTRTTQPSQSCCPMNHVTGGRSTASNILSSSLPQEPTSQPAFNAELQREDYLRLRDQLMCKICMERTVELTFLPCGHLACCTVCGQTLLFCPICRAKILASVKTYLS